MVRGRRRGLAGRERREVLGFDRRRAIRVSGSRFIPRYETLEVFRDVRVEEGVVVVRGNEVWTW